MDKMTRVYDGQTALKRIEVTCETIQGRHKCQVTGIIPARAEIEGKTVNVTQIEFTKTSRWNNIFFELLFVDMSSYSGFADAAAAGDYKELFDCEMFAGGQRIPVKVLGKKNLD